MSRSRRQKQLLWLRPLMVLATLVGVFAVYTRVYYESRDFVEEVYRPADFATSDDALMPKGFVNAFHAGRLDEACAILSAEGSERMVRSKATKAMYRGHCAMHSGEYWRAITAFEQAKIAEPSMLQQAEFCKILALIELDEKEQAIAMMEYYVEQPDFDFNRADVVMLLRDY